MSHDLRPRILLGPLGGPAPTGLDDFDAVDLLTFSPQGPIAFMPHTDTLDDVLDRVPGRRPDALILWSPESQAMPRDWERFDGPVFAVICDWQNLCQPTSDLGWLRRFERIFLDGSGVEFLRQAGIHTGIHALVWSFDAQRHVPKPAADRIYDIVFAGVLNHPIHRNRAHLMRHVASLADRHRVAISGWTLGPDEYADFIRSGKIVVNQSYHGALNMRAYEAMAVGALLMYEAGNPDAVGTFREGEHYVAYTPETLDEQIDYYLGHDAERERIARAGYERVQTESERHHIQRIATQAAALLDAHPAPAAPNLTTRTPDPYRTGLNLFLNHWVPFTPERVQSIQTCWTQAAALPGPNALAARHGLGVLHAVAAGLRDEPDRAAVFDTALWHFDTVLTACPQAVVTRYSRACVLQDIGRVQAAIDELTRVAQTLDSAATDGFGPLAPFYPYVYDGFWVDWMEAGVRGVQCGQGDQLRWAVLKGRCWQRIGVILLEHQQPREAILALSKATHVWPESGDVWNALGAAYGANDLWTDAARAFQVAQEREPFNFVAWLNLVTALQRSGNLEACVDQCDDYLRILRGMTNSGTLPERISAVRANAARLFSTVDSAPAG